MITNVTNNKKVSLPDGYKPSKDEEYMNEMQLEYFRSKLENWRNQLLKTSGQTLKELQNCERNTSDYDRASTESSTRLELRTKNRYWKLIKKIEQALHRIARKEYGYCEETGAKIGIGRLEARPVATLCVEAQAKREENETHYIDEDELGEVDN